MFSTQMARLAASSGVATVLLAGRDPLTYYGAMIIAGSLKTSLRHLLYRPPHSVPSPGWEEQFEELKHLPIELYTRNHLSLDQASRLKPAESLLVVDDVDLWASDREPLVDQVTRLRADNRCVLVAVPKDLIGPDEPGWQQWVRCADVIIEIEMCTGDRLGEVDISVVSNRRGPVSGAPTAVIGAYYYARFLELPPTSPGLGRGKS